MNVYPRIVEEVLYKHAAVREAAVIGQPSRLHGEVPIAYISLKPDFQCLEKNEGGGPASFQCLEKEIRAFCFEHLGKHEVPKKFTFVDDLPKNAAGKIVKRELRKQGEVERGIEIQ
jgi:long-chain acyl-CoA synthetase